MKQSKMTYDEDILFWAFRYALGRRTYAVSSVQNEIKRVWHLLSSNMKQTIQKEIKQADFKKELGLSCDYDVWIEILNLAPKEQGD